MSRDGAGLVVHRTPQGIEMVATGSAPEIGSLVLDRGKRGSVMAEPLDGCDLPRGLAIVCDMGQGFVALRGVGGGRSWSCAATRVTAIRLSRAPGLGSLEWCRLVDAANTVDRPGPKWDDVPARWLVGT